MNSNQKFALKREIRRKKLSAQKKRTERLANKHFAAQEHFTAVENKKHLPNRPNLVINSERITPACKKCSIKPRAVGSSRCVECTAAYRQKVTS